MVIKLQREKEGVREGHEEGDVGDRGTVGRNGRRAEKKQS